MRQHAAIRRLGIEPLSRPQLPWKTIFAVNGMMHQSSPRRIYGSITLTCINQCSGVGLSNASMSSLWVGLIVQFLLPSVIFSKTIPRQQKIGAFAYSIVDLENQIGSVGSAGSVAFAIEWMIIVHVAIISGCLLASNNPATSAAIVGLPPDETLFSPHRASTLDFKALAMVASGNLRTRRWKVILGFLREDGRIRHVPWFSQAYET